MSSRVPYTRLWPQIALSMIHLPALLWGLNRFTYERNMAILFDCAWVVCHLVLVSSIFQFNKTWRARVGTEAMDYHTT